MVDYTKENLEPSFCMLERIGKEVHDDPSLVDDFSFSERLANSILNVVKHNGDQEHLIQAVQRMALHCPETDLIQKRRPLDDIYYTASETLSKGELMQGADLDRCLETPLRAFIRNQKPKVFDTPKSLVDAMREDFGQKHCAKAQRKVGCRRYLSLRQRCYQRPIQCG